MELQYKLLKIVNSLYLSIYLPIYLTVCPSITIYVSIYPSTYFSLSLPLSPTPLSLPPFLSPSLFLYIYIYIYIYIYMYIYMQVYISLRLSQASASMSRYHLTSHLYASISNSVCLFTAFISVYPVINLSIFWSNYCTTISLVSYFSANALFLVFFPRNKAFLYLSISRHIDHTVILFHLPFYHVFSGTYFLPPFTCKS